MTPRGHPVPITEAGSDPPTKIESIILLPGTMDKESDDTSHATTTPIVTEGDKQIPQVIHQLLRHLGTWIMPQTLLLTSSSCIW